jgi:hypothetical protein
MRYPEQWREYRRWHLVACYGMLGFPAAVVIAVGFKVWVGISSEAAFIVPAVSWALLWGWGRSTVSSCSLPSLWCSFHVRSGAAVSVQAVMLSVRARPL